MEKHTWKKFWLDKTKILLSGLSAKKKTDRKQTHHLDETRTIPLLTHGGGSIMLLEGFFIYFFGRKKNLLVVDKNMDAKYGPIHDRNLLEASKIIKKFADDLFPLNTEMVTIKVYSNSPVI